MSKLHGLIYPYLPSLLEDYLNEHALKNRCKVGLPSVILIENVNHMDVSSKKGLGAKSLVCMMHERSNI